MTRHIRRVIKGKIYDTTTGSYIGLVEDVGGDVYCNSHAVETKLFQTAKGQFFIAGFGGASSRWRLQQRKGGYGVGEGIQLVTSDQAREMLEAVNGSVEDHFDVEIG